MNRDSPEFLEFEADFVESLRCIPMQVRLKLDTCGVKLKLAHWHQFNHPQRQMLVELPCQSSAEVQAYRDRLHHLVLEHTGSLPKDLPIDPEPAWLRETMLPLEVKEKAQEVGAKLTLGQWQALTPLQRFALIKLSRPGHENRNFLPAIKEFKLI